MLQTPDHHDRPQAHYYCPIIISQTILTIAHGASGHQGSNRTFSVLLDSAYSIGVTRDVRHHYNYCFKCQVSKAPANKPASLQPVIITRPWDMVASC